MSQSLGLTMDIPETGWELDWSLRNSIKRTGLICSERMQRMLREDFLSTREFENLMRLCELAAFLSIDD